MRPFAYERADRRRRRGRRRWPARPTHATSAGGTNLVDLMRLGVETPAASSTSRGCRTTRSRRATAAACASAPPCATATWPTHPLVRERYPLLVAGAAGGRLRAAAQPRHGRRQPAPAHPLRVLPGRHQAVQQARARDPAARRARATTATSRSSATRRPASPRTRPTWRSRWRRSAPSVHVHGPQASAPLPLARAAPAARRRRRSATRCSSTAS